MTKPIAKPVTKPATTKSVSKPAAPKTSAKPVIAPSSFIRVSHTTHNKLMDIQLTRSRKEGRRVSLGEVVTDLVTPKKK